MKFSFRDFWGVFFNIFGAGCFAVIFMWFGICFVSWEWSITAFSRPLIGAVVRFMFLVAVVLGVYEGIKK